jgi:tRNA 2-thiocytidine biosynthesis protein TtcA
MIAEGDHILVGLSGGADSLTLLWALQDRLTRAPVRYRLTAAFVDPGFENSFARDLEAYCTSRGYSFRLSMTDCGTLAHSDTNLENPCFLCARLRRRRLFEMADELGCNKLALGHNKDDLIETFFLNVCFAGEISTMLPVQPMFGGSFEVIRPLAYTDQAVIREFAHQRKLPVFVNPCPSAATSRRQHVKTLLENLYAGNSKIKGNIFRALHHVKVDYLLSASNQTQPRKGRVGPCAKEPDRNGR